MDQDFIKKIESGEIKMRPKSYFIWRSTLIITSAIFIFLVSAFVVGLVFFAIHESGALVLPGLGSAGIRELLNIFPWLTVLLALLLTFILSIILKRYSFAYRKPLLYLPIAVIVLIFIGGYAVNASNLHKDIYNFSEAHHTRVLEPFYKNLHDLGHNKVTIGQIETLEANQITMRTSDDDEYTLQINNHTQLEPNLAIGDRIDVIGDRDDHIITAIAVRKLTPLGQMPSDDENGFHPFNR